MKKFNLLNNKTLLENAKFDANAQFELAQLALANKRYGFATCLLSAAKKQGHVKAMMLLLSISSFLKKESKENVLNKIKV